MHRTLRAQPKENVWVGQSPIFWEKAPVWSWVLAEKMIPQLPTPHSAVGHKRVHKLTSVYVTVEGQWRMETHQMYHFRVLMISVCFFLVRSFSGTLTLDTPLYFWSGKWKGSNPETWRRGGSRAGGGFHVQESRELPTGRYFRHTRTSPNVHVDASECHK